MSENANVRMSDPVNEQLSAYLDGELAGVETDLLVKRIARDAELRACLGRYALVSELVKGDQAVAASRAFAAKVMSALDEEPALAASRFVLSPVWARRLRPAAGMAVAAGVAAVAVVAVQNGGTGPERIAGAEIAAAPAVATAVDPEPSYTVPSTTQTSAFVPAARLTNYVVAHSEYSSPLGRRTVLSGVLAEDDGPLGEDPDAATPAVDVQVTHP